MAILSRAQRLAKLKRLRESKAPRWIIRSEQVAAVLNRQGLHHRGIGRASNQAQQALYQKYVVPELDKAGADD